MRVDIVIHSPFGMRRRTVELPDGWEDEYEDMVEAIQEIYAPQFEWSIAVES